MIALWLLSLTVAAAPPAEGTARWGLRWRAPQGCISAGELARNVEQRLGRSVFSLEPELLIDGSVDAPMGAKARAQLVLQSADGAVLGSREILGELDCHSLDESVTLVIAVMIDPKAAMVPFPGAPPPPPPAARAAVDEAPVLDESAPPPRFSSELLVSVSTKAMLTPALSLGIGIGTQHRLGRSAAILEWHLTALPYGYGEQELGRVHASGGAFYFGSGLWLGSESFRVVPAVGLSATVLSLTSEGFNQSRTEGFARIDAEAHLALRWLYNESHGISLAAGAGYGLVRSSIRLLLPSGLARDIDPSAVHVSAELSWAVAFR